jgi:thymidylate synthase
MSADSEYDALVQRALEAGHREDGRNGPTRVVVGAHMRFSLEDGRLPFVTKKKLAWKTCLRELLWFVSGCTDATVLSKAGCKIWDANGSRAFLDSRGLVDNPEGDLGPVYGHQWRHFNAPYEGCSAAYDGHGVDQLQAIVDMLCDPETRSSRRIVMSAWNPVQLTKMALPPCHILAQFCVVDGDKLHCCLYQRSGDIGLGVPFNIASYAMLTHLLAHHCGLKAAELHHTIGNAHIYECHVEGLTSYLVREAHDPATLSIARTASSIGEYVESDFVVSGYANSGVLSLPFVA